NNKFMLYSEKVYEQLKKKNLKIEKSWLEETEEFTKARDFLHYKILSLTRKLRSRSYKKELASLKPSKWVLSLLEQKQYPNTTIVIEESVSSPMEAEEIDYSLNSAIENMEDS